MNRFPKLVLSGIVTLCTSFNLAFGLVAAMASSLGQTHYAACCLLLSVLLDAADGYLARRWGVASEFGAQLDSLADMTSFNVGGAMLTFYWLSPDLPVYAMGAVSCLYAVLGACRLARFNSGPKSAEEFQGMPTTSVATIVAATYLTCPQIDARFGMAMVALLAVLMVSHFPYPKTTRIQKMPSWVWSMLLLGGFNHFQLSVWICSVAYILSGPVTWLGRRNDPPATHK